MTDGLLFRQSLTVTDADTRELYRDKTVLVTGCGSIGSEICRQIAECKPRMLIGVDIYENNLYDVQQELKGKFGSTLDFRAEIASVRDRDRIDFLFGKYRPDVIFHAAAHKHVPLMEHSPAEAVKNNVFGTLNVVDMAEKHRVGRFIQISTDKAVNPTGVMGATKRLCERIIQSRADSPTTFTAVRFGNVLGSNGSVIPLFRRQIENGGPVTVTDKRMTRYFMTVSEAAQLVMCAGQMAKGGELFVLDMGEQVRILDLAQRLIRSYGLEPYKDVDIVETGLRPGEKLSEELLIKSQTVTKTKNGKIFVETDMPVDRATVSEYITALKTAVEIGDEAAANALRSAVPEYKR